MSDPTDIGQADLSRCSRCGRTGTLTSLSAGNTCEMQDECELARQETIERMKALTPPGPKPVPRPEGYHPYA